MQTLKALIEKSDPVITTLVSNPLMAKLAEQAGFNALYLGGGMLGYTKVFLEANLNITDLVQIGIEIRSASQLPLILDGATGFGDPMHMHRTIPFAESAGFEAIEIEDQIIPKRAHHHADIEHMIPQQLMVEKIKESINARRNNDFLIIARTNGIRSTSLSDALDRGKAYKDAGADVLMLSPRNREELLAISNNLEGPFQLLVPNGGLTSLETDRNELGSLGFKILIDASQPMLVALRAWKTFYETMDDNFQSPMLSKEDASYWSEELKNVVELQKLLEIETRTVEK
ncbi:MAG: isocitrate lyase/PEP mutase family protein [Dehalococcoidia bacterium]|nr:isocitrate lyase/PEP mutase family protein [Dehalococcoidia bacterium]